MEPFQWPLEREDGPTPLRDSGSQVIIRWRQGWERSRRLGASDDNVRALIRWSVEYDPRWDDAPDNYEAFGIVRWGKSRRLGLLRKGRYKAYVGVQHVDPGVPGWGIYEEPYRLRFFASMFLDGNCVALRTFPTMEQTLEAVASFVARTVD